MTAIPPATPTPHPPTAIPILSALAVVGELLHPKGKKKKKEETELQNPS